MNREALEQRRDMLRRKANESLQLVWQLEGAAQDCEFWLTQLPEEKPE